MSKNATRIMLNPAAARRVAEGFPWVYKSDTAREQGTLVFDAGAEILFTDIQGREVGKGYANPACTLMGRVLTGAMDTSFDSAFFEKRFSDALTLRQKFYDQPYYRLVHAESDRLPGLIIDRYGDVLVCQVNTAGMERLSEIFLPALDRVIAPKAIVLRNDTPARGQEGLASEVRLWKGSLPENGMVELLENGARFNADVMEGQKTGWFFDQRENRKWAATLAKGGSLLDVFCHTGGFGITAATMGATQVSFMDSSESALELARDNARRNGKEGICDFIHGKAFSKLEPLAAEGRRFDVVCVDPPAFIKSKRDFDSGLKGYEKLARIAAPLVKKGGFFFYASCSHHADHDTLSKAIVSGIGKAGCQAQLIRFSAAPPDHPVHPQLPETRYLKAFTFRILA